VNKNLILAFVFIISGLGFAAAQETPTKFISHKVKKKETIFGITRNYNITEEQLNEYNPLLEKVGLRRRMILRIPVYPKPVVAPSSPKLVKK
jgi:LysM repeat protein